MLSLDLHTHTIANGHAFNTLFEMVSEADRRGVKILGVTEHGPSMAGAPHVWFFNMAPRVPGRIGNVTVLSGIEANILSPEGELDLPEELLAVQDVVFAGLHEFTPYPVGLSVRENTSAVLGAVRNQYLDVIAHPYRPEFPVEVRPVVEAAAECGVLLEINLSLFRRRNLDEGMISAYRELVKLSAEYGQPLVISSDAHIATDLADDSCLIRADLGLDENLRWHPGRLGRWRLSERLRRSVKEPLANLHRTWDEEVP